METKFRDLISAKIKLPEDLTYEKTLKGFIIPGAEPFLRFQGFQNQPSPELLTVTCKDIRGENSFKTPFGSYPFLIEDQQLYEGQPLFLAVSKQGFSWKELRDQTKPLWSAGPTLKDPAPLYQRTLRKGNAEEILANSSDNVEQKIFIPSLKSLSYQPYSVFCRQEGKRFIIHTSCQWPAYIQENCARVLGIKNDQIIVKNYPSDFLYQTRCFSPVILAMSAALLCKKAGCSINLTADHELNRLYTPGSGSFSISMKGKVSSKGGCEALLVDLEMFSGPALHLEPEIIDRISLGFCSLYRIKNISIRSRVMASSGFLPDGGDGCGSAISGMALDVFFQRLCSNGKNELFCWKKDHLLQKGHSLLPGIPLKAPPPTPLIADRLNELSDFNRKYSALLLSHSTVNDPLTQEKRGMGMSLGNVGNGLLNHHKGLNNLSVSVSLDTGSRLTVSPSIFPSRPELYQIWRERAHEMLSIPFEDIVFDDEQAYDCNIMSKNVSEMTRLFTSCLEDLQKKRFREPLPLTLTKKFRKQKRQWNNEIFEGRPYKHSSYAGAVLDMVIPPSRCFPQISHIWMVVDCGEILNEDLCRVLLEADIYKALSWCCHRESDGYNIYQDFLNENPPTIHIDFLRNRREPTGLDGLAASVIPGAFLQAVNQVLYEPLLQLPVSVNQIKRGWINGD